MAGGVRQIRPWDANQAGPVNHTDTEPAYKPEFAWTVSAFDGINMMFTKTVARAMRAAL
jgi:hypothetical protein